MPLLLAIAWLATAAEPAVTLHVGIPRHAGDVADIAVEGARDCRRTTARIHCPGAPTSSVSFTWTGDPAFVLHPLPPEPSGTRRALVLSAPGSQQAAVERLRALRQDPAVDRHELLELRTLTVFTSDWTPPWPSPALLQSHLALLDHPDHRVRRQAVEGLHPWVAGTTFDPLPVEAPLPVPLATLDTLARDPDPGVRKRLARMLRTPRPALAGEDARALLDRLLGDPHPGVRRTALVALPEAVDRGVLPAVEAWEILLAAVPRPRPAGRAACNQLARMKSRLERAEKTVEVEPALEAVLRHHPERAWRVWFAWHEALPVREAWIRRLLRDTRGLHPELVRYWQDTAPDALQEVVDNWQPTRHPERATLVERLRRPMGRDDSLSGASEGSEAP